MDRRVILACMAAAGALLPSYALAQEQPVTDAAPAVLEQVPVDAPEPAALAAPAPDDPALCDGCVVIPALTMIKVELLRDMGSKLSKTGEMFPIRLAEPIMVGEVVAIPAGVTGEGEVIFAKGSGGGGMGGELVLAARYFDVGDRRLKLRSLDLSGAGKSNSGTAEALSIAVSPVLGFLVRGKQKGFPAGTVADAKTAEVFSIVPGSVVAPDAPEEPQAQAGPAATSK